VRGGMILNPKYLWNAFCMCWGCLPRLWYADFCDLRIYYRVSQPETCDTHGATGRFFGVPRADRGSCCFFLRRPLLMAFYVNKCRKNLRCQMHWLEGWGLGRFGNGFHTANAALLICSLVTALRKQCNKQTCLTY